MSHVTLLLHVLYHLCALRWRLNVWRRRDRLVRCLPKKLVHVIEAIKVDSTDFADRLLVFRTHSNEILLRWCGIWHGNVGEEEWDGSVW